MAFSVRSVHFCRLNSPARRSLSWFQTRESGWMNTRSKRQFISSLSTLFENQFFENKVWDIVRIWSVHPQYCSKLSAIISRYLFVTEWMTFFVCSKCNPALCNVWNTNSTFVKCFFCFPTINISSMNIWHIDFDTYPSIICSSFSIVLTDPVNPNGTLFNWKSHQGKMNTVCWLLHMPTQMFKVGCIRVSIVSAICVTTIIIVFNLR